MYVVFTSTIDCIPLNVCITLTVLCVLLEKLCITCIFYTCNEGMVGGRVRWVCWYFCHLQDSWGQEEGKEWILRGMRRLFAQGDSVLSLSPSHLPSGSCNISVTDWQLWKAAGLRMILPSWNIFRSFSGHRSENTYTQQLLRKIWHFDLATK